MRKILLLGMACCLGMSAYAQEAVNVPTINGLVKKISSTGRFGANDYLTLYDLESGNAVATASGSGEKTSGYGNCVSDNGILVGFIANQNSVTPTILSSDNEAWDISALTNASENSSGMFKYCSLQAITPDGTKAVGYINNPCDWDGGYDASWTNYYYTDYVPFICDVDLENHTLGEPQYLLNTTDYSYPNTDEFMTPNDIFGLKATMYTAEWISRDGQTITGMVVDASGQMVYPIRYTLNPNSEYTTGWDYSLPTQPLFDAAGEFPALPERPKNPLTEDPYEENGGEGYNGIKTYAEAYQFLCDLIEESGSGRLQAFKDYYKKWYDAIDTMIQMPYPENENGYIQAPSEAWDKFQAWYSPYGDWDNGGEQKALQEWEVKFREFQKICPFFMDHYMVLNTAGTKMVCTQLHQEPDADGNIDGQPMVYTPWVFDLQNNTVEKLQTNYQNLQARQIIADGTIISTTDPDETRASYFKSYMYVPGATEYTELLPYIQGMSQEFYDWMNDNLTVTRILDNAGATQEETLSGIASFSDDGLMLVGAAYAASTSGEDGGAFRLSYIFNPLGELPEVVETYFATPVEGEVPELEKVNIDWNLNDMVLNPNAGAVTISYNNQPVNVLRRAISADGKSLELTIDPSYIKGNGEYVITVPKNFVSGTDAFNRPNRPTGNAKLTYILVGTTGVEAIPTDGIYKVFSIDGVNVLNTTNSADIYNLNNGLYIINGKKVIIRK